MKFGNGAAMKIALLSLLMAVSASEFWMEEKNLYRLSKNAIPRVYNIAIEPNVDIYQLTWTGTICINIEIVNPTQYLDLHASISVRIDELSTRLVDTAGNTSLPINHIYDYENELLKLEFRSIIPVGNYDLHMKWFGFQIEEGIGFFKMSDNVEGSSSVLATNFPPTGARQVFPCWDEPDFKARFKLSIEHSKNHRALSNTPEISSTTTARDKILTVFGETPIMSTHTISFAIGNFTEIRNKRFKSSLFGSGPGLSIARRVLGLSDKIVRFMESYTGSSFGLPRVASVLMPDQSIACTGQWGLVFYCEETVTFNPNVDGILKKDSSEMLMAHELSRSWFGNRVTPLWWNDYWLTEAFTIYFQYYIMDQIHENWGGLELFVIRNNYEFATITDNEYESPITWTPQKNSDLRLLFRSTTHKKGAAIIHMFRNVIGDDVFRTGIRKYMEKHSFKTAVTNDLIDALQKAYDESPNNVRPVNLTKVMTPWLTQRGHPVIIVRRNNATGATSISQDSNLAGHSITEKWSIPLTYATKSNPNFTSTMPIGWISDETNSTTIDGMGQDDWIVVNVRASGFYQVSYDDENWNRLSQYLNSEDYKKIHVLNRAQLFSDLQYLKKHETKRYYDIFYKLTGYLSREVEYLPWRCAYSVIKNMEATMRNSKLHEKFQRYFLKLMQNFIDKVGFEVRDTDDHFTKLSRMDVIMWACMSGHRGCTEYAAEKILKLMKNPVENSVHPDVRSWIFCAGLRGLNETSADEFANWTSVNGRNILTQNLGCTVNHKIQKNIIDDSLTRRIVEDPRETGRLFVTLLTSNDENFRFAVDYFVKNHQIMEKTTNVDGRTYLMVEIVSTISAVVASNDRLEKFKEVLQLESVRKLDQKLLESWLSRAEWNINVNVKYTEDIFKSWNLS